MGRALKKYMMRYDLFTWQRKGKKVLLSPIYAPELEFTQADLYGTNDPRYKNDPNGERE